MLIPEKKNSPEGRLTKIYAQLSEAERKTLLDFAEFLVSRSAPVEPQSLELKPIPRPAEENVVAALKRLRETYHMLDHSKMLNDASALMAQHMIQGRAAEEVIDELEQLFQRDYDELIKQADAE